MIPRPERPASIRKGYEQAGGVIGNTSAGRKWFERSAQKSNEGGHARHMNWDVTDAGHRYALLARCRRPLGSAFSDRSELPALPFMRRE
jgi:hypothetical protein